MTGFASPAGYPPRDLRFQGRRVLLGRAVCRAADRAAAVRRRLPHPRAGKLLVAASPFYFLLHPFVGWEHLLKSPAVKPLGLRNFTQAMTSSQAHGTGRRAISWRGRCLIRGYTLAQVAIAVGDDKLRPTLPKGLHPGLAGLARATMDAEPSMRPSFASVRAAPSMDAPSVG